MGNRSTFLYGGENMQRGSVAVARCDFHVETLHGEKKYIKKNTYFNVTKEGDIINIHIKGIIFYRIDLQHQTRKDKRFKILLK